MPEVPAVIRPTTIDGETRILDIDLAERLGFARPSKIRELIERHVGSLNKISVLPTVGQTLGASGGRPSKAYYLNRKQAIFVTAKSETEAATEITIEIIERFDAYERGAAPAPAPALNLRDPGHLRSLIGQLAEVNVELTEKIAVLQP